MGHHLLPTLPDTTTWRTVVGLIADGADVAQIAAATAIASQRGFVLSQNDPGLCQAMWLLTKVVLAAREKEFGPALSSADISLSGKPSLYALIGGFSAALDRRLSQTGGRSDIGEMAQLAAVETLNSVALNRPAQFFNSTSQIQKAIRGLSTQSGFANLSHEFFSRFANRFIGYHLGRELSHHVGGNGRFADSSEHTAFVRELANHCREVTRTVRKFAREWYSKANFEGGVSPVKARHFVNHALIEVQEALVSSGVRDG